MSGTAAAGPAGCHSIGVIVETKVVGSGIEAQRLSVPAAGTVRDLLTVLVRHELTAYERRRTSTATLRVLTPADLADGAGAGSYGREARAVAAPPSPASAVDRALEAFADGLYFVFLDDVQLESLDTTVAVRPDSTLRLIRLVALAGG